MNYKPRLWYYTAYFLFQNGRWAKNKPCPLTERHWSAVTLLPIFFGHVAPVLNTVLHVRAVFPAVKYLLKESKLIFSYKLQNAQRSRIFDSKENLKKFLNTTASSSIRGQD